MQCVLVRRPVKTCAYAVRDRRITLMSHFSQQLQTSYVTCDSSAMTHPLWLICYDQPVMTHSHNPSAMTHQLWLIRYDSYAVTHQLWLISYDSATMTHTSISENLQCVKWGFCTTLQCTNISVLHFCTTCLYYVLYYILYYISVHVSVYIPVYVSVHELFRLRFSLRTCRATFQLSFQPISQFTFQSTFQFWLVTLSQKFLTNVQLKFQASISTEISDKRKNHAH